MQTEVKKSNQSFIMPSRIIGGRGGGHEDKRIGEFLPGRKVTGIAPGMEIRPTKLLVNVTVERGLGAVQVVMAMESRVQDVVAAVVRQYVKEGRRPFLVTTDPAGFDLHYSQFSLESLDKEEKLQTLGSRNFFLCPKKGVSAAAAAAAKASASPALCSDQVGKSSKIANPWSRFIDFLM